jgi:IK cytokine
VSALEQAPLDDDGDIFADVGEYEGVDLDGTDDEDAEKPLEAERNHTPVASSEGPKRAGGWFGEQPPLETPVNEGERTDHTEDPPPAPPPEVPPVPDGEDEEHVRLRPLASSTVPSIREMLAADDALAADEKRRARKEKRKKA